MRFLRYLIVLLGIMGMFGCTYTVKVDRPANKSQVQQHSQKAMSEMKKAQQEREK